MAKLGDVSDLRSARVPSPILVAAVLSSHPQSQASGTTIRHPIRHPQAGIVRAQQTISVMIPWNAAKAKVQLRLSVQRLRTLQEKKNAQAKASRRDIAVLLEKGKIETARIKVENIINEDIYIELLELLELYCELLISRFGLLDQGTREPDPGVSEGVCSVIYAAPRTELKELHVLREILMHKFGREFSIAVMDNRNECVTSRVTSKLKVETPSRELVDAYLGEIAKGYGIEWVPPSSQQDNDSDGLGMGVDGEGKGGANTVGPKEDEKSVSLPIDAATISEEAKSMGAVVPKLPELPPSSDDRQSKTTKESQAKAPASSGTGDDFDTLAARFAALKKR